MSAPEMKSIEEVMDTEVDNTILPDCVSTCLQENQKIMEEIVEEDINFDYFFVTLQDENYDKRCKRFKIERIQLLDIKFVDEIELNVNITLVATQMWMKLHKVVGEALVNCIGK